MSNGDIESIPAGEARRNLGELVASAFYRKTRVCISKHGRNFAALVPIEDLELLQALEDRYDLEVSLERLASDDRIPLDEFMETLAD